MSTIMTSKALAAIFAATIFTVACNDTTTTTVSSTDSSSSTSTSPAPAVDTTHPAAAAIPDSYGKTNAATSISYTVAENYFLKNTVQEIPNPKVDNQADFEQMFGMATTMGDNGKPTKIDFSKQFVIVVTKPETDVHTELRPVSLIQSGNDIVFTYKVEKGAKQSYTMKPLLAVIVEKNNKGKIVVKEQ